MEKSDKVLCINFPLDLWYHSPMKFRWDTLQSRLFITFSLVICLILLACFSLFYGYFSVYCSETVSLTQINLCSSISDSIDSQIQQMNTVSMNVVYSKQVAENIRDYLSIRDTEAGSTALWRDASAVFDALWAIIGPFQTVSQVNLYSPEGVVIGSGLFNNEGRVALRGKSWYLPTLALAGSKYLGDAEKMPAIDVKLLALKDHRFIPLCRVFQSDRFVTQGIVEVLQDSERIFAHTETVRRLNRMVDIYVLNSRGVQVYPDPGLGNVDGAYYRNLILRQDLPSLKVAQVRGPRNQSDKVLTAIHSELSDWDIVVVEPWEVVYEPLRQFTLLMLVSAFILVTLGWIASFLVARHLTGPLKDLQWALSGLDASHFIDPDSVVPALRSNQINEIEKLNYSFRAMFATLQKSTTDLVTARSEETKAKMLALQSLMNPHFVYNNLATISALAEAGQTREITVICSDISRILRYISTDSPEGSSLEDEVDITDKYLQYMKIQYGDDLNYTISLPSDLYSVVVPKLIIQPLVENCIKHGFHVSPPWQVHICGSLLDGRWQLAIEDNGIGFEPSALELLETRIKQWQQTGVLPPLGIDGLGLLNIKLRLALFYGSDHLFEIRPNPAGGAIVVVGGSVHAKPD